MADDGRIADAVKSPTAASMRDHRIAALQRRIAMQHGNVRQQLEARLQALIATDARRDLHAVDPTSRADVAEPEAIGPLGKLAATIADRSPCASYPELEALSEFRALWSTLRADVQLRQSLEQDTGDSGPLNSGRLVYRALAFMRDCSPDYTRHFLSYVDALSWMEPFDTAGTTGMPDTGRSAGTRPRVKRKPRKPAT